MLTSAVGYEVRGQVAWITINQPETHNALSAAVRSGLWEATHRFNADEAARVMVLTGAGEKAFCAGGDLKEMAASELKVPPPDFLPHFGRNIEVPKPTIAAVNGVALAGGFLLAQMCDLCLAADHVRFGITEIKVGRGAPWAVPLAGLIGTRAALQLLLTGDPITARRAYELGLVNEIVPIGELRTVTQQIAEGVASNAPLSVQAAKRMVDQSSRLTTKSAFDLAERVWEHVYLSEDAQEGPRAFAEGRPPRWQGR
jgi:enoyl-CoA hydratase/carnithine racemase